MKIFGYADEGLNPEEIKPSELAEITLVASPGELRVIARFLESAARGMEDRGKHWEHEHLADKHSEFKGSPHFVVFNPDV
jgi:hypothetical protein